MDRFLVSLFPLLRRFAGFLVRSFFRASFPYFFRLKKGLFLPLEPNSLVFRNWRKLARRRRRRKRKIRSRFIVVVAWGIAIWSSLSIIDAVAPPAPLLLWRRRRRRRVVVGNGDLYFCGQSQPTGAEEGKSIVATASISIAIMLLYFAITEHKVRKKRNRH